MNHSPVTDVHKRSTDRPAVYGFNCLTLDHNYCLTLDHNYLSQEPILIHVPDSSGRFYLLQFMDAWTETFADPDKRTTGNSEALLAVVGPVWSGKLPDHVTRLDARTNLVWLLGRTQTNRPSDYDHVRAFQRGMRMSR